MVHEFTVTDSKILLDAPIIAVRQDTVVMPGGHTASREIVEHFGAVGIVAYNAKEDTIALVRQWRQCVQERLWELPAGILDISGENELVTAKRELVEEAGLVAEQWDLLLDLVSSPGFCEEAVRVYLARGLHPAETRPVPEDEEADMTLEWVKRDDVDKMLARGEITNGIAVAGLLTAFRVLDGTVPARSSAETFHLRPSHLARRRTAIVGAGEDMKISHPSTTAPTEG